MSYTRMFRGKMRMSTCRIILITSLAWLLIDVIIIMKYTDGLGGGIFKKTPSNEVSELENQSLKQELVIGQSQGRKSESKWIRPEKSALFAHRIHTKHFNVNCSINLLVFCEL